MLSNTEQEIEQLRNKLEDENARKSTADADGLARNAELMALREQLKQLQSEKAQWDQVALENQQLRQQVALLQKPAAAPKPVQDAVADQAETRKHAAPSDNSNPSDRDKFEAFMCANHLFQIGLAVNRWADAHDGHAPLDFLALKQDLAPMILICPSVTSNSVALGWGHFDPAMITYRILRPGMKWTGSTFVFADCPIHRTTVMDRPNSGEGPPGQYVR